jgi:hypothetical protein
MRRRRPATLLTALIGPTLLVACASESPTPTAVLSASPAPSAIPANRVPTGIAFFDSANGVGVGSAGPTDNNRTIWRTHDGGATWTTEALPGMTLRDVTVIPGTALAWAGAACGEVDAPCHPGVLASTDGGTTWQRDSSEAVVSISFPDATHGWAVSPEDPTLAGPRRACGQSSGEQRRRANMGEPWQSMSQPRHGSGQRDIPHC